MNADLLHFQSAPSSSIGGVDLIGAKVAAQASVRNAIMSKGRFIAVLLFPACPDRGAFFRTPRLFDKHCNQALVSTCLRGLGKWLRPMGQIVSWPPCRRNLFTRSRPQSGMLTGEIWTALRRQRTCGARHWDASFTTDIATGRLNY